MTDRQWVPWEVIETVKLCKAWLATAKMPMFWENPTGPKFWALVREKHHALTGSTHRGEGAIRSRFSKHVGRTSKTSATAMSRRSTTTRRVTRRKTCSRRPSRRSRCASSDTSSIETADSSNSGEDEADGQPLTKDMEESVSQVANANEQASAQASPQVNGLANDTDQAFIDADVGLTGDETTYRFADASSDGDDDDSNSSTARINSHHKRKANVFDFWKDLTLSYARIEKRRLVLKGKQLEVAAQRAMLHAVTLEAG